jgi:hypothetical protein
MPETEGRITHQDSGKHEVRTGGIGSDRETSGKKMKKVFFLHMATGNLALIPAKIPLTRSNGSRCGQGYEIPTPYPYPRDP